MNQNLRLIGNVRRREWPVTLLLFLFFFLVIAVFQVLKPLKSGLFLEQYGADLELYAKLANIAVAGLGALGFSLLFKHLRRQHLIVLLCAFFLGCFLILTVWLRSPSALAIWGFYFLGDLESTLMVTAFWAYATDLTRPEQAKRLFGFMGAGSVIGGWVGAAFAKGLLAKIGMSGLLLLASVAMVAIAALALAVESLVRRDETFLPQDTGPATGTGMEGKSSWRESLQGARLVWNSRYLLAIVGIMACYEAVSQIMDYQFKRQAELLSGVVTTQAFIANVYFYANAISVLVQLFLVSFLLQKFGVKTALMVLPLAMLGSSAAFLAVPTLFVSSLLVISDNGLNYSIQQTARESLFLVTSREEKYRARAFTNMFIQRLAKGLSILGILLLGLWHLEVRWLSLGSMAILAIMIACSLYAGRRFQEKQ